MNVRVDKKWLIGGGIAASLLVVIALVAWIAKSIDIPFVGQGQGGTTPAQAHTDVDDQSMPGLDLSRCVDLWNGSREARSRGSLAALVASYVSVTTSDLYPGKCLVTGANPELNLAAQFLEAESESPYAYEQIESGEASSLPASVTDWNATADSRGYLTLNPRN